MLYPEICLSSWRLDITPHLFSLISKRTVNKRTVKEALDGLRWVQDIRGLITWEAVSEFLQLWDSIAAVQLQHGVPDRHYWRFSSSGIYTAKSAYEMLFHGSTSFEASDRIWRSWAPPKCSFFLWLALHDRCWTADRLARRNLPHPEKCLLCDQEEETINHLLVGCVFSRQFWVLLLQRIGLAQLSPQPGVISFDEWWRGAVMLVNGEVKKGLNSLIILGAWSLWRHRNDCVFEGLSPSLATVLTMAGDALNKWSMAGARGLCLLSAFVEDDAEA